MSDRNIWSFVSPGFFEGIKADLGESEFTEPQKAWLAELVAVAAEGKARVSRTALLRQLEDMRKNAIADAEGRKRIGRPVKHSPVPERLRWILIALRHWHPDDSNLELIERAIAQVQNEERAPSQMDWPRYAVIHTLNAAWGRRFPNASTRTRTGANEHMRFSLDPVEQEYGGPFFRVVLAILRQAGRSDSEGAIARAIENARRQRFAV